MSNHFFIEFVFYVVGVVGVLSIYGSVCRSAASVSAPISTPAALEEAEPISPTSATSDDVLADFTTPELRVAVLPAELDAMIGEIFLTDLVMDPMQDAIVPFVRKYKQQPAHGLGELGIRELRQIASQLKINQYSRKSKRQLIALIHERQKAA